MTRAVPPKPGDIRDPRPAKPHQPRRPRASSETVDARFRDLIELAGGGFDSARGQNVGEIMGTALKLVRDGSDLAEIKLINRSLKELRYALKVFRPYRQTPKISIFGSARTPEDHPDYLAAVRFARLMAETGWMVITGAGDGIMKAGHDGAQRERSFGVSIRLPFETNANATIVGDPKLVTFRYFFTRKLMFMWMSHAIALFPGGFGTQDEGFEALTLIQTGKAPLVPIVMIDAPGGDYWHHWDNYITHSLMEKGWISPEDKHLYFVTDDADAAARHVRAFYRNYHSQRFVRDRLVLRLRRPLAEKVVDELNAEFRDLVAEGRIEQSGPLPEENDHADLPRVHFESTKRAYGRLRMLIDRINAAG